LNSPTSDVRRRFDERYYERFYRRAATRVTARAANRRLAAFIAGYVDYLELTVHSLLDIGCGTGALGRALQKCYPRARYTGIDVSEYACRRYGWQRASVVDYRCSRPFDLVICNDVLQYLTAGQAARAIDNLAELTGGPLYLGVLTARDWRESVDQGLTDERVHLRSANWYRQRLARHFKNLGGGMYVRRDSPVVLYELESF
jgi:predicted TPR repeat methyltransferase